MLLLAGLVPCFLKLKKVLGRDGVRNGFFGQEINITTYNLCGHSSYSG